MSVESPVSERLTVTSLLLLTFATGLVDAVSVLALGHVFVANMTGNVIFLGFWFVPHSGVDLTAALVAFISFVAGTVLGGRLARHIDREVRLWLTVALGVEVVVLADSLDPRRHRGAELPRQHQTVLDRGAGGDVREPERDRPPVRYPGAVHHGPDVNDRRASVSTAGWPAAPGTARSCATAWCVTMCAGAVVGATMTRFTVAPVIALAAAVVAVAAAIFRFGPPRQDVAAD